MNSLEGQKNRQKNENQKKYPEHLSFEPFVLRPPSFQNLNRLQWFFNHLVLFFKKIVSKQCEHFPILSKLKKKKFCNFGSMGMYCKSAFTLSQIAIIKHINFSKIEKCSHCFYCNLVRHSVLGIAHIIPDYAKQRWVLTQL